MVLTRKDSLEVQLEELQIKLKRSEQKLDIVLTYIRKTFGETNFLLNDLWKLLRDFDQESSINRKFTHAAAVGILRRRGQGHDVRDSNSAPTSRREGSEDSSIPSKPSVDKGRVAYVLVESLDTGISSIIIPQQSGVAGKRKNQRKQVMSEVSDETNSPVSQTGTLSAQAVQTEARTSTSEQFTVKVLCTPENPDEVVIPDRSDEEEEDEENENEDTLDVNSDPLRLSNPPSPISERDIYSDSSSPIYEPDEIEIERFSDSQNSRLDDFVEIHPDKKSITPNQQQNSEINPSSSKTNTQKLYTCTTCEKQFLTSRSFAKHHLVHETVEGRGFIVKPVVEESKVVPDELPWFKKLRRSRKLQKEIPVKKAKEKEKVTIKRRRRRRCEINEEDSKTELPKLKKVIRANKKAESYICEICGKPQKGKLTHAKHLKMHKEKEEGPFPCSMCEKILGSRCAQKNHEQLHSGFRPYLCSICGNSFARTSTLEIHMKIHSEEKTYKCTYCGKGFKQKQGLMTHINRHLRRNEKQCSICGLLHSSSTNLKRHMNAVHWKNRPHKCHLCDKAFKETNHLKYHLKTHDNPNSKKRGLNRDPGYNELGSKRMLSGKSHCRLKQYEPIPPAEQPRQVLNDPGINTLNQGIEQISSSTTSDMSSGPPDLCTPSSNETNSEVSSVVVVPRNECQTDLTNLSENNISELSEPESSWLLTNNLI